MCIGRPYSPCAVRSRCHPYSRLGFVFRTVRSRPDGALPSTYLPPIPPLHRLLLSRSRWAGYLQSLPNELIWDGIALFWGAALRDPLSSRDASDDGRRVESGGLGPDSDAVEARQWLRGTEAETHLLLRDPPRTPLLVCPFAGPAVTGSSRVEDDSRGSSSPYNMCQDDITGFYFSIAAPVLERAGLSSSERGFQHAYALVSSRAFMVDAYHALAMVPIADA